MTQKLKFAFGMIENIVEKGEKNACNQHFLIFPIILTKDYSLEIVKSRGCVVKSERGIFSLILTPLSACNLKKANLKA